MRFFRHHPAVTTWVSALFLGSLAAGCGVYPVAPGDVSLSLRADFRGGARALQSVATPYTAADVAHLYMRVFEVVSSGAGEDETTLLDAQNQPVVLHIARDDVQGTLVDAQRVTLAGLRRGARYRVKAAAYANGDETTGALISVPGTGSQTDVPVEAQSSAPVVPSTIQVQLANTTFDGKAYGPSVTIHPGGFTGVAPATL